MRIEGLVVKINKFCEESFLHPYMQIMYISVSITYAIMPVYIIVI